MLTEEMQTLIRNFSAGSVATVNEDGTPSVSPKATFVILDDATIAFGDIRSPGTIKNLSRNPAIEVCFTDILTRRAVRVTGRAVVVLRSEADTLLEAAYAEDWEQYQPHVRSYVKVNVSAAQMIFSPAYDIGLSATELCATNLSKLETIAISSTVPGKTPDHCPHVTFQTRVRNDSLPGPNPYEWRDLTSREIFEGKNIVLFAVPGAFTPACSESHLPGFEDNYEEFQSLGIDQVVCLSVNDPFVMFQWARSQNITKVVMLSDGNGVFTKMMGMLVDRSATGMGPRSWRYAMHVKDGVIQKLFSEPGKTDNPEGVPVQVSDAETMLRYLRVQYK